MSKPNDGGPAFPQTAARTKGIYIGAPACFELELAMQHLASAFGRFNSYVVGSALKRADWRDVDVVMILDDEEFSKLFPNSDIDGNNWEFDSRWLVMTCALSVWLSQKTGLPIDFKFQPRTKANETHKGPRNAIGLRVIHGVPA